MSLFARPHYTSEITQFLQKLKQDRPELEAAQQEGRARLWDQTVDTRFNEQVKAATLPQKAYVYQTEPSL